MTLKNAAVESVISLTATLEVYTAFGTSVDFTFDVTPSHPLQPNRSTSAQLCLIGGGFGSNVSYPLTINATLQSGDKFVYTKLVQIVKPPLMPTWGWAIIAIVIVILVTAVIVLRRRRAVKA
jgi:subtilase family serine protease